jgi:hypothetical protein
MFGDSTRLLEEEDRERDERERDEPDREERERDREGDRERLPADGDRSSLPLAACTKVHS